MSNEARRLELMEWLRKVDDDATLDELEFVKNRSSETETDWWDELPDSVKESIEKSEQQIKEGKTIPHSEVRKRYEKRL